MLKHCSHFTKQQICILNEKFNGYNHSNGSSEGPKHYLGKGVDQHREKPQNKKWFLFVNKNTQELVCCHARGLNCGFQRSGERISRVYFRGT